MCIVYRLCTDCLTLDRETETDRETDTDRQTDRTIVRKERLYAVCTSDQIFTLQINKDRLMTDATTDRQRVQIDRQTDRQTDR